MSAASIAVHYSRDDGSTWTAYGSDTDHRNLVTLSSAFRIGGPSAGTAATVKDQLRIQLNANIAGGNIYCNLRRILVYLSTAGSGGCTCTLQYRTIANYNNNSDTWTTAGTYNVNGWSGWNSIPFANAFGGGSTQTGQIAQIRLIFKATSVSSTYTNLEVYSLRGIAFPLWQSPSTMASTGHLYTFDIDQNATFPAQITATQFNGLATKATGDKNGADIATTYLKLAGGTMTGVLTAKGNIYEDSYSGALNMNNSNIYGLNSIYTSDTSDSSAEGIHFYRDTTHVDSIHAKSGVLYFTPNRPLGEAGTSYSIYHTGITTFSGNATTATEFSSNATVTLTGDTTGTSAGSKKSWSITTTTKKLSQTTATALSSFTDTTALIYTAAGGSNAITDKPTSVDAFGCLSFKTAEGWYGQLLMSSNVATGLYWRTATSLSGGWKKLLDANNYTDYTVKKDGTGASGTWGINVTGNAATATSATRLSQNKEMTYGWSGVNYFNIEAANQSAAKVNDTPFSSATWTHILRFNHANNLGYYTDLAIPFNANSLYYKRVLAGTLQNASTNGGWIKMLDQFNYTDYTVTKTGSGASGSWGISVTGTSANVTGTVAVANGGTGKTTTTDAINNLLGGLPIWSANPSDSTYFIRQDTGGAASYGKVPFSTLWNYIKGKSDSTYVTLSTAQTITGRKTFNDLAAVTFKPSSGTDKCNINYDASLGALVFSF